MTYTTDDYDNPWKEALERYFEGFMAFFFPLAHQDIQWTQGYAFLDKELQQVVRDAELGKRLADKLVKVQRKDGAEIWVLIHIEIQAQTDADFAERMFVYHYRLFDRYQLPIVSLAVLGDNHPNWRPCAYDHALWGCHLRLDFPTVKLLDYRAQWDDLQPSTNPFAILLMAHLKTQDTQGKPAERLQWKLCLVKTLYQKGFGKQDILEIYRFIDWLMVLPDELNQQFDDDMMTYEQEIKMPYITTTERAGIKKGMQLGFIEGEQRGIQKGMQKGMQKGEQLGEIKLLKRQLTRRFGSLPDDIERRIDSAPSAELELWADRVLEAQSLSDIFP